MSKILCAIGALTALTIMAGPASAHDAYQVRHELQERGYYSTRFVDTQPRTSKSTRAAAGNASICMSTSTAE